MADPPPETARRAFLLRACRASGVALAALDVLEGRAQARGEETDMAILHAALMLEHHAIALYGHGLKGGLFPPGLKGYATEFRGDHLGHRDTQVSIIEERGGSPPPPRARYDFGTTAGRDLVRAALAIERTAQEAYTALMSQIRSEDYLLSAAFILVDEVRHMTVWRRVLGIRLY